MKCVLGLDIGTSGLKGLLLAENGEIVKTCSALYSPDYGANGFVEQDPAVWWDAAEKVIKEITIGRDIAAISCSGQMHSSVFLDKNHEVIRPAILWNDTRTTKQTKEIYGLVGGEAVMLENVYNRALEGFTLPKILWLKENKPENFKKIYKVIMPKDYINFMLTGHICTDFSDAAGTVAFDVKNCRWSEKIIKAVGLEPDIFTKVIESTDIVGIIKKEIAAKLGLTENVKIVAGGADNSCAAIGSGVISPGEAVISIGTSGTVIAFLDKIDNKVTGDVHLFNYSYPGSFYAMGCMLSAGESLNWLKKNIMADKTFDEINELAEKTAAGSGGLIFLPYLFGERSPYNDPNARGVFFGISGTTGPGEIARAVMEGVAYNFKTIFDIVGKFSQINTVYITGGGAKSRVWSQLIADVLGVEIEILNFEEGPAFGAALIGAVGCGIFESFNEAKDKTITVKSKIMPDLMKNAEYQRYYRFFAEVYEGNRGLFEGRMSLYR